jgi:selenocysteine lyase/cysteine desulfurase
MSRGETWNRTSSSARTADSPSHDNTADEVDRLLAALAA